MLRYLKAKDWRRMRAGYRPEMARIPRGAAADRKLGRKKTNHTVFAIGTRNKTSFCL